MTISYTSKKQLFLSELYPPTIGGSCTMFAGRFQYEPNVVVLTKKVPNVDALDEEQPYSIFRKKMDYKGPKGFEWLGIVKDLIFAAIPIIRKHRIQVIQCARPIPEGVAGMFLSTVLRKKLIVNYHGEDISVFQRYKVERLLIKKMLKRAHLNLFNSSYTQELANKLSSGSIEQAVIYPGFCSQRLQIKPDDDLLLKKFPNILTVGRFQRRKGQDHVIHAIAKIVEYFPNLNYTIIGSQQGGTENWLEYLHKLIKDLNLEKHVSILENITNEQIPYFYHRCDLFVMPNRKDGDDVEGFGIVFMEASFCRKPVIGGKAGGSVDAIENGVSGYLVDGDSIDEIAAYIVKILENKNLAFSLGENGHKRSLNFTHKALFLKYKDELRKRNL